MVSAPLIRFITGPCLVSLYFSNNPCHAYMSPTPNGLSKGSISFIAMKRADGGVVWQWNSAQHDLFQNIATLLAAQAGLASLIPIIPISSQPLSRKCITCLQRQMDCPCHSWVLVKKWRISAKTLLHIPWPFIWVCAYFYTTYVLDMGQLGYISPTSTYVSSNQGFRQFYCKEEKGRWHGWMTVTKCTSGSLPEHCYTPSLTISKTHLHSCDHF